MILIEGKKYACETCIKGHRSSACKHTERPLFEIQKKGRPITQCSHCRELRKTKQVHVKCQCGDGKGSREESGTAKAVKKAPDAAFPAGVPATLEASLTLISDQSSDSDQSAPISAPCNCSDSQECHCSAPRKIKRTRHKDSTSIVLPRSTVGIKPVRTHLDPIRDYRPVLPKPPPNQQNHIQTLSGPVHLPSTANGHLPRHNPHADMFYSPYGRAYETVHSHDRPYQMNGNFADSTDLGHLNGMSNMFPPNPVGQPSPWNVPNLIGDELQSLCACGESCTCAGCFEHRGPASAIQALLNLSSGSGCTDPSSCSSCIDCSAMAPTLQMNPTDLANAEEWIKQFAPPSPPLSEGSQPLVYAIQQQMQASGSQSSQPHFNNSAIQLNPSAGWIQNRTNDRECCGDDCPCPPGLCPCNHNGYKGRRFGDQRVGGNQLTFAVSGERNECCSRNARPKDVPMMDSRDTLFSRQASFPPSDEMDRRSRASSIGEGVQEAWNRDHVFNTPMKSYYSKERTTLPQMSLYAPTNDSSTL